MRDSKLFLLVVLLCPPKMVPFYGTACFADPNLHRHSNAYARLQTRPRSFYLSHVPVEHECQLTRRGI